MRLFVLRHPEKGDLAEGVEWTNGRAVLKTGVSSITSYLGVKEVIAVFKVANQDYKDATVVFLE